jgi:hypothetical protein
MSSRFSLVSEIPLNTLPRTLRRSLKCSRFRRLGAQNLREWQSLNSKNFRGRALIPNGSRPNHYGVEVTELRSRYRELKSTGL